MEWEYLVFRVETRERYWIENDLNRLGNDRWELIMEYDPDHLVFKRPRNIPKPPPPVDASTQLSFTIEGAKMATTFTVDTTDGVAVLQFTDSHGDAVAGPNDSVTGSPVVPVVDSDNTAALTAAAGVAGANPGTFTFALTPVAEGVANLSVAALVNSDGSPVLETAGPDTGQAFDVPAPVEVTVAAGAAEGLTLAVTG